MEFDPKAIGAVLAAFFLTIQGISDRKRRMKREARREVLNADLGTKADVVTAEHKAIETKMDHIIHLIEGPRGVLDCMDKVKEKIE